MFIIKLVADQYPPVKFDYANRDVLQYLRSLTRIYTFEIGRLVTEVALVANECKLRQVFRDI